MRAAVLGAGAMAVRARRRAAVALGLVGAGCAVLGLALVLAVPGIVRDQVEKVRPDGTGRDGGEPLLEGCCTAPGCVG